MIRNLTYRIPIREGSDSIWLTRYLELEEGCDVSEEFLIETSRHSIGFISVELVELHAAIDEMLRMRDQHVDALIDGASVGAVERAVAAEALTDGAGEPYQSPPLSPERRALLRGLAGGPAFTRDDISQGGFEELLSQGFIAVSRPADHNCPTEFAITDAGRAALKTSEPESAASTADEADLVSADDIRLLGMLSEGVTLEMNHPALTRFRDRGWVMVTDESMSRTTGNREYAITAVGRRALAAQTPEGESELDVMDLAILQDLAEPGESLISFLGGSAFTWGLSGEDSSFTRNDLSRLYEQRLICFSSTEEQAEELKGSYHISAKGRRVLAERAG